MSPDSIPHCAEVKDIRDAEFRANPQYDLISFEKIPDDQREILRDFHKDPEFFGILRPRRDSALAIKSICHETASLFLQLKLPGKIPDHVKADLGEHCSRSLATLVLDGVLEIRADGKFVSQSEAAAWIYENPKEYVARGRIARLSLEALQYAQQLAISDPQELSARLYFFNRLPVSANWIRQFPSTAAVREHLGVEDGSIRRLDWGWSVVPSSPGTEGWISWQAERMAHVPRPKATYKLYVSPHCSSVRKAFQETVGLLMESQAHHFKVGRDVYGLLRPDKIVVYFRELDELKRTAVKLEARLAGCMAHGVPFSAELTNDGLLSWGIDPPADQRKIPNQERESWRLWVTNRLATAILAAKNSRAEDSEPWRFALWRLSLENIDTNTWTPGEGYWRDETASSATGGA